MALDVIGVGTAFLTAPGLITGAARRQLRARKGAVKGRWAGFSTSGAVSGAGPRDFCKAMSEGKIRQRRLKAFNFAATACAVRIAGRVDVGPINLGVDYRS